MKKHIIIIFFLFLFGLEAGIHSLFFLSLQAKGNFPNINNEEIVIGIDG